MRETHVHPRYSTAQKAQGFANLLTFVRAPIVGNVHFTMRAVAPSLDEALMVTERKATNTAYQRYCTMHHKLNLAIDFVCP